MKLEELFPLIYCINLDERKDRWEQAQKEFSTIEKLDIKRFSAIKETPGYVGCWKSHLEILKEAREKDVNVLIFEDDVLFVAPEWLDDTIEQLQTLEWDMFYLGGNILRPFFQVTRNLARLTHCQSTHAYAVNKRILNPLIGIVESNPNMNIDVIYADAIVPNVKAYISVPMIAIQRESHSDILGRSETYDLPIKRYFHYLVENEALNV